MIQDNCDTMAHLTCFKTNQVDDLKTDQLVDVWAGVQPYLIEIVEVSMVERREVKHEVVVEEEPTLVRRRRRYVRDLNAGQRIFAYKVTQFIWLLFGILEIMIMLRFFLQLLAANANSAFADFVYDFTDIFLWPFANLFNNPTVNGMVVEVTSLLAVIAYAFLAWVVVRIVWLVLYNPQRRVVSSTYEDVE